MTDTSERRLQPVGAGIGGTTATAPRWRTDHATPARKNNQGAPTTRPNVLVVDDDADVRMLLTMYLALDGFHAQEAEDAATALEAIRRQRPDMVLLDVMMPGRDGLDLLAELRRAGDIPVIMVTARGEEADRVMGLRLGADDYIVKPFSPAELVARITAVLRRRVGASPPAKLEFDGLDMDLESRKLTVKGRPVSTTTKEFDLLSFLASSPSHVFTRGELLDKVWGSSAEWQDPGTVTEHVRRIRHLIEDDPARPQRIRTVRGVGYSFEP
ncbi:MAG TPA: response regulator transcription factor [Acidimicrobiales bacterium]|nr:response regulator transcription factor [Acidimicrobiales bacterium]